ncbi:16S rRNA (cytosine(1402)-N(4))-methyltransferase RsmH [Notoacmeibacter sp. MSK16QG-6]|uniref:16S rRNA (cytosine(1402)-N(4))-methyltransferase RsmH n=1 Tax=Notoacmeibacter sp. MSK16QG-6 TaxID=2957982 RepID=UPI00209E533A|nr:16S rRNA (cytosine(1402)-N(4))-methyltransferase RsmH [Notoacmeibacter sp. MSK16QG-6]MCP1199710.1 16S rRNA (cytosine(1402)-N(4))-methyltransferase RsmH [Notoacmeibacter sp. MSK16QG-6]
MMAGHEDALSFPGGPARHIPVLLLEVIEKLAPQTGETMLDGTFGAGGYSRAILECGAHLIAMDRDPDVADTAEAISREFGKRFRFVAGNFGDLDDYVSEPLDGIVLDIGVSSMQLDQAERGFSFQSDGPLDMRMAQSGLSAADVVNSADVKDLTRIFGLLGEEKQASRVARMIGQRREEQPFTRTGDLAKAIADLMPRRAHERIHPATRSFQGLRIFVNDELGELVSALEAAERILKPGGRLVVVTFHSLEDRIVKRFMQTRSEAPAVSRHMPVTDGPMPTFEKIGGAISASDTESAANPRARSARLRAARRTHAPARPIENRKMLGLPDVHALRIAGDRR